MKNTNDIKLGYEHFSYFDQFKDMELDLSKFLERFSKDEYELKFSNLQPVKTTVKNIFEQFQILDRYKTDASSFLKYKIQDNERIEMMSYKFYDTIDFWWVITAFNNIKNPFFDLPLSEEQVVEYSKILTEREGKYPQATYYKLLAENNETKREILIPRKMFISDIIWNYREAILKDTLNG